ncbi:hypothetical protein GX586_09765, partial [bacterium]|nr:hypothetical protein [bacterium]
MVNALRTALPALMLAACAHAAPAPFSPHVGYLYPAGGRQGATFEIMAGGQFLRGVNSVHITGEGVQAKVVQHAGPLNNEQRIEARRYIAMLIRNKLAGMPGASARMPRETHELLRRLENPGPTATNLPPPKLPRHPTLRNIDGKSLPELRRIAVELSGPNRNPQGRMQISDLVVLEITVAPDAPPGMRELRLGTPAGMTNPLRFDVGLLPEVLEQEPNERISLLVPSARDDRRAARQARPPDPLLDAMLPMPPPVQLPATINGQIMPGDTDCFTFHARKGQQLVMDAQARRLRPYLADAVPGWFQATLALYDTNGNEMAFTDDYRLQPDPVMLFNVPADGEYRIEIRDAI